MPSRKLISLLLIISLTGLNATDHPKGEPKAGTEIVHPADGAIMVYVPSGFFTMGLSLDEANRIARQLGYKDYQVLWMWETFPKRQEYCKGFFIDKYEVTIERWQRFLAANPDFKLKKDEISRYYNDPRAEALPVATVYWDEAQKYANWAGKQLPSERQWEKAARGTDGRLYPWGNSFNANNGHFSRDQHGGWDNRKIYTRVGRYPDGASPYGAMDMLGNQYELTADWVEPYPNNPERKKMLSYSAKKNVCLRGGSWYHGKAGLYASKRFGFPPDETHYHVGFRTVWEPPEGYFASPAFEKAKQAVPGRKEALKEQFKRYDEAEKKAIAENQ